VAGAHLEFDVSDAAMLLPLVGQVCVSMTTVAGVNVVVGFSPPSWAQLRSDAVVRGLDDFRERSANGVTIAAAQHGLRIWLHGGGVDGLLDAARLAARTLAPAATLAQGQLAFP
jgi:hypothetical protein